MKHKNRQQELFLFWENFLSTIDTNTNILTKSYAILKVHPFVKIGMKQKLLCVLKQEKTKLLGTRHLTGFFGFSRKKSLRFLLFIVSFFVLFSAHPVFADEGSPTTNNWKENFAKKSKSLDCYFGMGEDPPPECKGNALVRGVVNGVNGIIVDIITFLGWVANAAAGLLSWTLNPQLLYGVMQDKLIYAWWSMVRDVLNIFFIGVLLLSALSTIFGIDKYHYNKILAQLIIMALLVNFSFPIARFVIDVSNRLMYFFLSLSGIANSGLDTFTSFGNIFLEKSEIINVIVIPAQNGGESFAVLLASAIFLFLFATALLTLAISLLIRVIALILLVISSPVGFVGQIVPGMGGYASKWWNNLFRYAFFGPAALLMLTLSVAMMASLSYNSKDLKSVIDQASNTGLNSISAEVAGHLAMATIPIILIYFTIGIGSRMSIKFADKAEEYGKWGTNALVGAMSLGAVPFLKSGVKSQASNLKAGWDESRKQVAADRARRSFGTRVGKGASGVLDRAAGATGSKFEWQRDAARRGEMAKAAKRNEKVKQNEEMQKSYTDLIKDLKSDDTLTKEAAALTLANKKDFRNSADLDLALADGIDDKVRIKIVASAPEHAFRNKNTFKKALEIVGNDPGATRDLIGKATSDSFKGMSVAEYQELRSKAAFNNNENLQNALDGRMKDNKAAHILAEANGYDATVKTMTPSQLANQSETFYTNDVSALNAAMDKKIFKSKVEQNMFQTAADKSNNDAANYLNGYFSSKKKTPHKTP